MSFMFYQCTSLRSLDLSNFKTINVTCMRSMFNNCESLRSLDLSDFKTKNVTVMSFMFSNCGLRVQKVLLLQLRKKLEQ